MAGRVQRPAGRARGSAAGELPARGREARGLDAGGLDARVVDASRLTLVTSADCFKYYFVHTYFYSFFFFFG